MDEFENVDFDDFTEPLLLPSEHTILMMEEGNFNSNSNFNLNFNQKKLIKSLCDDISEKNGGKLAKDLFYFDMFSFDMLLESDNNDNNDEPNMDDKSVVIYWMPADHPIAMILKYNNVNPVSQNEKNCEFGDIVIHLKESVDWCIEKIIIK